MFHKIGIRTHVVVVLACLLVHPIHSGGSRVHSATAQGPRSAPALAVIVNAKNPTTGLTMAALKYHFKLKRTYWSNKKPSRLFLRPAGSPEMDILLKEIYRVSYVRMRRDFVAQCNRGRNSYVPQPLNRDADAIERVRKDPSAFTVIMAASLPAKLNGIRVLSLDKKKPGEPGYPLLGKLKSQETEP